MNKSRDKIDEGVTEDDINEIKQDISSFRYELLEILRNNGMEIPDYSRKSNKLGGSKRHKKREVGRRLSFGYCVNSAVNSPSINKDSLGGHGNNVESFSSSMDDLFDNIEAAKRASDSSPSKNILNPQNKLARSRLGQIVMKTFQRHRTVSRDVPDDDLDTELGSDEVTQPVISPLAENLNGRNRGVHLCPSEEPLIPVSPQSPEQSQNDDKLYTNNRQKIDQ